MPIVNSAIAPTDWASKQLLLHHYGYYRGDVIIVCGRRSCRVSEFKLLFVDFDCYNVKNIYI